MLPKSFTALDDAQIVWIKYHNVFVLINNRYVNDVQLCMNNLSILCLLNLPDKFES